jgi:regulator of protease activity HflC (stomatin/prohibitin superfamily)
MRHDYGYVQFFDRARHEARVRRGSRVVVEPWEQALLFRRGVHVDTLGPGAVRLWTGGNTLRRVDMRPWIVTLPVQEVPTADGVTVKVTVAGRARVVDPVAYVLHAQDAQAVLYLAVQVALRELVAGTTVDDLVGGRAVVGRDLTAAVGGIDVVGVAVAQLDLKDVVLPADLKRAQAEVLMARAQGLAALERARGETAALRNLANAARLAADNPTLLQLRLLQQLAATSGHTVVIGGPPTLR